VRGGSGGLRYEFTAFQMDFDNQITPVISGGLANANANAGSTLHRCLETAVNYRWNNGFSIDGNLIWIPVSEYRENRSGGIIEGNRLPNSPELLANLSVGYASGPSDVALLWRYVDEQFGSGDNSVPIAGSGNAIWSGLLPSYYTVDLTDSYDLNKQLKLFGAVKNLIDEHYIAGLRQGIYAGPERAFEVGAKFTF
jgi:Fe(3+) dicitrate transport protein